MRKYELLRRALAGKGIDQKELASILPYDDKTGVSISYLTARFTGRKSWRQDHMYFIMDLIEMPYSQLSVIFPLNGIQKEQDIPTQPRKISRHSFAAL